MPENKPIATPLENEPLAEPIGDDAPGPRKDNAGGVVPQPQRGWRLAVRAGLPVVLMLVAAVPRFWNIGRESYWYDEVVTVEVARSSHVIATLKTMDASSAPLHPLILHVWISWFGEGERATRTLSALFGLATVTVVFGVGRKIGGWSAGCWAMAFAALSPLLVQYDRETRMYSLLTMLTCLAWWNLLRFRESGSPGRCVLQATLLALIAYAHPLGLLMIAGLGAGWLGDWRRTRLAPGRWVAIHAAAAAMIAPWIGNYLDHPPEFFSNASSLRMLIGMPIGFTGGNSGTFLILVAVAVVALTSRQIPGLARPSGGGAWPMLAWLTVAPTLLFVYSHFGPSLFGPSRYTVFVAPAYFVLIGCGLSRLRVGTALLVGGLLLGTICLMAVVNVVQVRTKADWRGVAGWLAVNAPDSPVVVIPPHPGRIHELIVARYYLGDRARAKLDEFGDAEADIKRWPACRRFYSQSVRDGKAFGDLPTSIRQAPVGPSDDDRRGSTRTIRGLDFSGTLRLTEIHIVRGRMMRRHPIHE